MPEDLRPQIDLLKNVLDALGISRYEQAGIEADDILGTLSRKFSVPSVIVTGDKDSFQLVNEHTSVYFTKRGISDVDVYNNDNFTDKTGIKPPQIVDLKSLMGDSSDNIPGISGVGEKTALNLVKTCSFINTFSFRFIFIRSCYPAHFHRILFICLCARQQHNLYFLLLDNIILCALFLCNIAVLVCNISIAIWQHFSICMIRIYK